MVLAIISAVLWGLVYALDMKLVNVFPVRFMMCLTGLTYGVALLPGVLQSESIRRAASGKDYAVLLFVICANAAAGFLMLKAMKETQSPFVIAIEATYPAFTMLFTFLLFRGDMSPQAVVGTLIVILGSTLILTS